MIYEGRGGNKLGGCVVPSAHIEPAIQAVKILPFE